MNNIRLLPGGLLMLLAGALASGVALADRVHVGVYVGGPYFYHPFYRPYFYPFYPYPYYPPVVVEPSTVMVAPDQSSTYIEQANPPTAPSQPTPSSANSYWYHCDKPDGYYPYIKQCPGGWKAVEPTPPPQH